MSEFKLERLVNASPKVAWSVISDVVGFAEVAPNLSKAEIISGQGQGMQRRCWDTHGGTWTEQCLLWEEDQRYSFAVDTSDYPYPLSKMQGTWGLAEQPDGVLITMHYEYVPKYGPLGWLMDQLYIKLAFRRICEELMDNWENQIAARLCQTEFA